MCENPYLTSFAFGPITSRVSYHKITANFEIFSHTFVINNFHFFPFRNIFLKREDISLLYGKKNLLPIIQARTSREYEISEK